VDVSEDLVPDFAMTIRPMDECIAAENSFDVLEVDPVNSPIAFALFRMPSEVANACEQSVKIIFRHGLSQSSRAQVYCYTCRIPQLAQPWVVYTDVL
jgi:hypothetical protein